MVAVCQDLSSLTGLFILRPHQPSLERLGYSQIGRQKNNFKYFVRFSRAADIAL